MSINLLRCRLNCFLNLLFFHLIFIIKTVVVLINLKQDFIASSPKRKKKVFSKAK